MNDYTVTDLFDKSSPYYSGAVDLAVPPSAQPTGSIGPGAIGTGE